MGLRLEVSLGLKYSQSCPLSDDCLGCGMAMGNPSLHTLIFPSGPPQPLNYGLLNTKHPQSHLPPQPWLPAKGVEGLLPVLRAAQAPRLRRSWSQEKWGRWC